MNTTTTTDSPSLRQALEAVAERTENLSGDSPEYERGQLELLADLFPGPAPMDTECRMAQIARTIRDGPMGDLSQSEQEAAYLRWACQYGNSTRRDTFMAGWRARGRSSHSPEAVERAAQAIYEANRHRLGLPWERLIEVTKEDCRILARAALYARAALDVVRESDVPVEPIRVIELEPVLDLLAEAGAALDYADPGLVVCDEILSFLRKHGRPTFDATSEKEKP